MAYFRYVLNIFFIFDIFSLYFKYFLYIWLVFIMFYKFFIFGILSLHLVPFWIHVARQCSNHPKPPPKLAAPSPHSCPRQPLKHLIVLFMLSISCPACSSNWLMMLYRALRRCDCERQRHLAVAAQKHPDRVACCTTRTLPGVRTVRSIWSAQ